MKRGPEGRAKEPLAIDTCLFHRISPYEVTFGDRRVIRYSPRLRTRTRLHRGRSDMAPRGAHDRYNLHHDHEGLLDILRGFVVPPSHDAKDSLDQALEGGGVGIRAVALSLVTSSFWAVPGPGKPLQPCCSVRTRRTMADSTMCPHARHIKDRLNDHVVAGAATVNPEGRGTKCVFLRGDATFRPFAVAESAERELRPSRLSGELPMCPSRSNAYCRTLGSTSLRVAENQHDDHPADESEHRQRVGVPHGQLSE